MGTLSSGIFTILCTEEGGIYLFINKDKHFNLIGRYDCIIYYIEIRA